MTNLMPFTYEGQAVRSLVIDGEPWFVLADLAKVLGIVDVQRLNSRLDDGVRQTHPIVDSLGRTQQATIVSEVGMYEVVIRSDKPDAVAFRRWITGTVLPEIRRTGSFNAVAPALSREQRLQIGFEAAQEVIAEQQQTISNQAAEIETLRPSAEHWDQIIARNGDMDVRQAAQWLSVVPGIATGQNRLFAYMRQLRWIDKKNRPYQHVLQRGLLASRYDGEWTDPDTGQVHVKSTTMVRMKGLALLRKGLAPESQFPAVSA